MSGKLGIRIGAWLFCISLFLFAGYFLRRQQTVLVDVSRYAADKEKESVIRPPMEKINAADIVAKNIFHPLRGAANTADKKKSLKKTAPQRVRNQFEITGIFRYQGMRGALITSSTPSANLKGAKRRCFYKLGDSLGNGYNLVEISETQVIIAHGSERMTLPLRKKQDKTK